MTLRSAPITGLALAAGLAALAGAAVAQTPREPHHLTAAELKARVAKVDDGMATAFLPTTSGAVVVMVRRDRDGEAEVHDQLADQIVVMEGHGSMRIGDAVSGNRVTAPGEHRGGVITGGKAYDLSPGDTLWIPAGLPHQMMVPKGETIRYLAAKFPDHP